MEYLQTALNEVVSASELAFKNPASIDLLGQALELLELANSAVNDRSISAQTYKLKSKVVAFIDVICTNGDSADVQHCFQEVLNNCAFLEDMCNNGGLSESNMESPSVVDMLSQSQKVVDKTQDIDLGSDALHCLQRQILGLDNDVDREHLEKVGISKYVDKPMIQKETSQARELEDEVHGQEEGQIGDIQSWSDIIASTRASFGDDASIVDNGSVQTSRMLGSENDDADMIGDLGQFLNGVIASLEKENDRRRALENAKRLPPFARRDAVIAIRAQLSEIKARGDECIFELTSLLTNDVLSLLNGKSAILAVCDALEALALAWQVVPHRSQKQGDTGASDFIYEARRLVDIASQAVQANSRRRRVAIAAANKKEMESEQATNEWYSTNEGGEEASCGGVAARKFDIYARKPTRKVGKEARDVGKQRKKQEKGSIQLSRHCEYEPSFHEVSGLKVGTSQIPLGRSKTMNVGRQPRSSALNTSSIFRAPPTEGKRWVLSDVNTDDCQVQSQQSSYLNQLPPSSSVSDHVDMSALLHYQKKLSVSIPKSQPKGVSGKKSSVSLISPQLTF